MNRITNKLLSVAQYMNRRTASLGWLKSALGLNRLAENILNHEFSEADIKALKDSVNHSYIANRIDEWNRKGRKITDVCVIFPEKLGDLIACEPITRKFRQMFANAKIHWLVKPQYKSILEYNPNIDELITIDCIGEAITTADKLERERGMFVINCIYDCERCPKTGIMVHNPSNPQLNFYNTYYLGSLLTVYCALIGIPDINESPRYYFKDGDSKDCVHDPTFHAPNGKYAVVHTASDDPTRCWNADGWTKLVEHLIANDGYTVLEIGGTRQVTSVGSGYIDFTGRRDINDLAIIINNANLFVGIDSSFAHIANATRTPTVQILGRYLSFKSYMPHAGEFASSKSFEIVKAANGDYATEVNPAAVIAATDRIISLQQ